MADQPTNEIEVLGTRIPQAFIDSLPAGPVSEVKHVEQHLLRFQKEVPMDYNASTELYKRGVQMTEPDQPEGVKIKLTSVASVALPSMGQCVVVRERSGNVRPVILHLPLVREIYNAQRDNIPSVRHQEVNVFLSFPDELLPGVMKPRLKYDQELMILNIYKSPYGCSYQLYTLDGIPEPITRTITMYGLKEWQREKLETFTGIQIPDERIVDLKAEQYLALPIGTFHAMYEVVSQEIRAAKALPKQIRLSMSQMLLASCRLGGHDPFAGTKDEAYEPKTKELETEDFFRAIKPETLTPV